MLLGSIRNMRVKGRTTEEELIRETEGVRKGGIRHGGKSRRYPQKNPVRQCPGGNVF
jgi:hypothetical protein